MLICYFDIRVDIVKESMGCWWCWFGVLVVWIFQHKRKSMGCWWWWFDVLVVWIGGGLTC